MTKPVRRDDEATHAQPDRGYVSPASRLRKVAVLAETAAHRWSGGDLDSAYDALGMAEDALNEIEAVITDGYGFASAAPSRSGRPDPGEDAPTLYDVVHAALLAEHTPLPDEPNPCIVAAGVDYLAERVTERIETSPFLADPAAAPSSTTEGADTGAVAEEEDCDAHAGTEHDYLSTGCLHGEHGHCQSITGQHGEKRPARCKFCDARCVCFCHHREAPRSLS